MTWWVGHDQRDLAAGRPSRRPRPRPQVGDDSSRNLRRCRHCGRNFPHCPRLPVDGKLDQLRLLLQVVDLRFRRRSRIGCGGGVGARRRRRRGPRPSWSPASP